MKHTTHPTKGKPHTEETKKKIVHPVRSGGI
ncbi:MAG: hypothetical protein GEU26_17695 [Nitrososphaeraceae archaeon]|nr:hypothetical protein [Nitrososphaeraceae archaeon]